MCLAAIYWARLDNIYYAADKEDAAAIGFDDRFFYQEINKPINERKIPQERFLAEEAKAVMTQWAGKQDKITY